MVTHRPNDSAPLLSGMSRAVEVFREHDREGSMILLQVFLTIASAEDHSLTMSEVARKFDISQATLSYNIARLGSSSGQRLSRRLGGDVRLNLVEMRQDLADRRRYTLGLTRQGRNLATAVSQALATRL